MRKHFQTRRMNFLSSYFFSSAPASSTLQVSFDLSLPGFFFDQLREVSTPKLPSSHLQRRKSSIVLNLFGFATRKLVSELLNFGVDVQYAEYTPGLKVLPHNQSEHCVSNHNARFELLHTSCIWDELAFPLAPPEGARPHRDPGQSPRSLSFFNRMFRAPL